MKGLFAGLPVALLMTATAALAAPPAQFADSNLGRILVDERGMTLYKWDNDAAGVSNCYDQCAVNWPPFMASADAEAEGDWTIVDRTDGTKMWAYRGMPLYYWVNDAAPGDTTGDGVGGTWHVVKEGDAM